MAQKLPQDSGTKNGLISESQDHHPKRAGAQKALKPIAKPEDQGLPEMRAFVEKLPLAKAAKAKKRIALIGLHGIGEQLRYDTIQQYTAIISDALSTENRLVKKATVCELSPVNGTAYPHAVLEFKEADGEDCELHIFEAYWSPITKGHVTFKDSIDFLYDAGKRGLAFARATRNADRSRFAFNRWLAFPKEKWMVWLFAFMLAVVASIAFLNTAFAATAGYQLAFGKKLNADNGLCKVAMAVVPCWSFAFLLGIVLFIDARGRQPKRAKEALANWKSDRRGKMDGPPPSKWFLWFFIYLTLFAVIFGAVIIAISRSSTWSDDYVKFLWNGVHLNDLVKTSPWLVGAIVSLLLVGTAFALRFVQHFLVWYVGDLVVYFSATRPTTFSAVRQQVQESVQQVFRDVYGAKQAESSGYFYGDVIVAAHSLGTVIAYEAFNQLIGEDVANGTGRDTANRTRLFLTLGSPLDKYAYLFRYQQTASNPYREGMAQATQPMISSYDTRPRAWVNIWSVQDPISGDLGFYDDPEEVKKRNPKVIMNLEDPIAQVPFAAHSQYFENPLLRQQLLARL